MKIVQGENEAERLEALKSLQILGSERLPEFDSVVEALAAIFDCPIALISLVAEEEQWFKARCGLQIEGTPRDISFCQHAILSNDLFVVPDALSDERFCDNPIVTGEPHIRFYAGCPLSLDGHNRLGTLCVIDRAPRSPTLQQLDQLKRLGKVAEGLIKSHLAGVEREAALNNAEEKRSLAVREGDLLEEVTGVSGVGGWELCLLTDTLTWTSKTRDIHEVPGDFVPTVEFALSFYPPDSRDIIRNAIHDAMDCGSDWDVELPFVTAKGRNIWVRAVGRPVFENGKVVRLIGALQDVTERKQTDQSIRYSDALQRTTLQTLSEGIVLLSRSGRIQSINTAGADLLGFTPEKIVGSRIQDLDLRISREGDDANTPFQLFEFAATAPDRIDGMVAYVARNGASSGSWLRVNALPIDTANEYGFDGVVVSLTDISKSKRAEQALRNSEAIQRTTLDALSEGILLLSRSGSIVSANPAAERLLGYSGDGLAGRTIAELDLDAKCEVNGTGTCSNPLDLAVKNPDIVTDFVIGLTHSAQSRSTWLRINAKRIDPSEKIGLDGVVVSLVDITEAKQQADTLQVIFDNFPGGFAHYDEDFHLASCNGEFVRLLNYPQDLIDRQLHLLDYLKFNAERGDYGEGEPETLALEKFNAYDRSNPHSHERSTADGAFLEIRGTPLPDGGAIYNFFDVTDRKRMEVRLAENERLARHRTEELEAILANMRQGVSVFDEKGRLTLWNQQYIDIFGKSPEDVHPGVSLVELIEAEKSRGEFQGDVQEHVMDLLIRLSAGEVVRSKFSHPNGKIISAVHAPMPGGGWIGTHEDVTSQELAVQKIEYAAHHDTLTGLANRTLFNAKLEALLAGNSAFATRGDVMLLDLDRFKPVNDTYGHDVGDELLKQVALRLKECVRSSDLVARLGGDEFGIIIKRSAKSGTEDIARRIVRSINAPFDALGHSISVGVSIGISTIQDDAVTANPIIKNADLALYEVKKDGRNGFRFFDNPTEQQVVNF